ncbi:MAG: FAD-dependent oxidoreductase [Actinomycetota bacterium]
MGAGLAGTLMAIYFARRRWQVDLYELRPDCRITRFAGGRSINLTLATRGLAALARVLDLKDILDITIPLEGRMVHSLNGSLKFHPYGTKSTEVIHAVTRCSLNARLMDLAERYPNIRIWFNHRCTRIDKKNWAVEIYDETSQSHKQISPDFIVGADGTFSTVRQQMQRNDRANFQQDYLECGYKELVFAAGPGNKFRMHKNRLHLWPRGKFMLMAIPNLDGTFASNCILPMDGHGSFSDLDSPTKVVKFFEEQFPDAVGLIEDLPNTFLRNPVSGFLTTRTLPWYQGDRMVLIGDACHTVVPFYGLGMNAAFEDCSVLDDCIGKHPDRLDLAFQEYQQLRKLNTDVLGHLSVENFVELRDKVRSYRLIARKKLIAGGHWLFPKAVVPLYTMMSHTTIPFAEALRKSKLQDRRMRYFGSDIAVPLLAGFLACKDQLSGALGSLFKKPRRIVTPIALTPATTDLKIATEKSRAASSHEKAAI